MKSELFVKQRYPQAKAQKYITVKKEVYWVISDGTILLFMGRRVSENKAWMKAKQNILDKELETKVKI